MTQFCPHCGNTITPSSFDENGGTVYFCQCQEAYREYEQQQRLLFERRKQAARKAKK